ncbi:dihydrofolate reductase family protein [Frankia sp. AgB32]|nr:dihydrofolate reductase family protein [Frankia sp. AgB32]
MRPGTPTWEIDMRLTLHTFLTLDGVMQAPGGPDEDRSSGFEHGGWSFDHGDEDFGAAIDGWFAQADAFLLGRRTYEIFAGHWPRVTEPDNPVARALNTLPKHVASTTLAGVDWPGARLLAGDVPAAVTELKRQPGRELQVHGSGRLAHTLIEHDLVDEYRLMIFPVHLGTGLKLFADGLAPAKLRLTGTSTTSAGVIIATYVPAGPVTYGSYALDDDQ